MANSVVIDVFPRTHAQKMVAYAAGAQVNAAQSSVNTVNVHLGHGFATNDLFLYGLAEDNILTDRVFTVTGTTVTTVTFSGSPFSFPDSSVLINLELDTVVVNSDGSWPLPVYDGSSVGMYSDPSAQNAITSKSIRPDGELQFWTDSVPVWCLTLSNGNRPVRVYRDVGASDGGSGSGNVTAYVQAGAPSVGLNEGDIWVKPASGGDPAVVYIYANSTWVEVIQSA